MAHRRAVATVLGFPVILSIVLLGLASASPVAAAPDPQDPSGIQPFLAGCGLSGDIAKTRSDLSLAASTLGTVIAEVLK